MLGLLRRNAEFRRLFLAHAVSRAGDAFNTVALVILVYRLTRSGLGVSGVVAFEVLPVLLFGPVAGLLADRLPRRSLMVAADLGRATVMLVLVVWHGTTPLAYGAAFLLACGSVAFNPAASSVLPELVGADELVEANSTLWTVAVTSQIVLAPAAGGIIAVFGVGSAFAVNALSFVASAALLLRMRSGRSGRGGGIVPGGGWSAVTAGVAVVRSDPLLRRLAVVQVLASLSAGATSGLLVVLAARRLGVGAGGFGVLLAAIGAGAAAGPLVFRRRIRPARRLWLFGPLAARGGVDLVLAAVRNPALAGGALVIYGMSTSTGTVAFQSTLQTAVPPESRGRVFALYDVLWNAARLLSLGLGGLVTQLVGVSAVYVGGAALLLLAAAVGFTAPLARR